MGGAFKEFLAFCTVMSIIAISVSVTIFCFILGVKYVLSIQ